MLTIPNVSFLVSVHVKRNWEDAQKDGSSGEDGGTSILRSRCKQLHRKLRNITIPSGDDNLDRRANLLQSVLTCIAEGRSKQDCQTTELDELKSMLVLQSSPTSSQESNPPR